MPGLFSESLMQYTSSIMKSLPKSMKSLAKNIWEKYYVIAVCFGGLGAVGVISYCKHVDLLMTSDTIQSILVTVLVVTTMIYARSTHKSYQVALNAEMNAALPIIALTVESTTQDRIVVSYQNVGKGPALYLRIWLERAGDKQFAYLKSDQMKDKGFRSAVGAGQGYYLEWNRVERLLPTPASGFDVVAEYNDIFLRIIMSKLIIIGPHDRDFRFGIKNRQGNADLSANRGLCAPQDRTDGQDLLDSGG